MKISNIKQVLYENIKPLTLITITILTCFFYIRISFSTPVKSHWRNTSKQTPSPAVINVLNQAFNSRFMVRNAYNFDQWPYTIWWLPSHYWTGGNFCASARIRSLRGSSLVWQPSCSCSLCSLNLFKTRYWRFFLPLLRICGYVSTISQVWSA